MKLCYSFLLNTAYFSVGCLNFATPCDCKLHLTLSSINENHVQGGRRQAKAEGGEEVSGHCQEQLAQTLIFRDKDWKGGIWRREFQNQLREIKIFTSYWKVFCILPGDLDVFGWRSRWVALVQMMGPKKGWCAVETNCRVRNLISTSSIPTAFEVIWILREKRLETVSLDLSSSFGGHNKAF